MFVAHSAAGARVDITRVLNPSALKGRAFTCPQCGKPVFVRAGAQRAAHFSHHRQCVPLYDAHPESPEHQAGKRLLKALFQGAGITHEPFEFEVPVPMPWRARGRIADVLVEFPMGWRFALEIQLAPIAPEELHERTEDYLRGGVDVAWFLGGRADTPVNRAYCLTRWGAVWGLESDSIVRRTWDAWRQQWEKVSGYCPSRVLHPHLAFVRLLEIWGRCNMDIVRRGFRAQGKLLRSFAGMLGQANSNGKLTRRGREWYPLSLDDVYPDIPRLSPGAIEIARKRAKEKQPQEATSGKA